jgi:hypothetical protein
VALAGGRGTHKSRLAFAQILKTLRDDPDAHAVVISLQEDEAAVKNDLCEIDVGLESTLQQPDQRRRGPKALSHIRETTSDLVNEAVASGRLELSYYPPGFIAPEEFFHRVQLSIARHASLAANKRLLLVFNSLDLLHSHFPLCAHHSIFVPALVELLCLENVTSFFITTSSGNDDPYGLMSMADPILRFSRVFEKRDFFTERVFGKKHGAALGNDESIVRMIVERFAAGVSAGAGVFLALIVPGHPLAKAFGSGLRCFVDKAQGAHSEVSRSRDV